MTRAGKGTQGQRSQGGEAWWELPNPRGICGETPEHGPGPACPYPIPFLPEFPFLWTWLPPNPSLQGKSQWIYPRTPAGSVQLHQTRGTLVANPSGWVTATFTFPWDPVLPLAALAPAPNPTDPKSWGLAPLWDLQGVPPGAGDAPEAGQGFPATSKPQSGVKPGFPFGTAIPRAHKAPLRSGSARIVPTPRPQRLHCPPGQRRLREGLGRWDLSEQGWDKAPKSGRGMSEPP